MLSESAVGAYAWRGVSLRAASRTHVGLVRGNNEDSLVLGDLASGQAVLASGRIGPAGVLFGVCDGMGGAAAGEVASHMAAREILRRLARLEVACEPEAFQRALAAAVVQAGQAIRAHVTKHPAHSGMGTTCTVAAVRGGLLLLAHVGDSRAYLMREGELRQLTADQTWANELLSRGHVSPEEAILMENGRAITQAVGVTEGLEVALMNLVLRQGDRVLICSDGLSGMVSDSEIARAAQVADLENASEELLRLAIAGGGRDNISFTLCEFSGAVLASERATESEYPLPVRRWPRRAVVAGLGLLALGMGGWGIAAREQRNHGTIARAAQASEPGSPEVPSPDLSLPMAPPLQIAAALERPAAQLPAASKQPSTSAMRDPVSVPLAPDPPATRARGEVRSKKGKPLVVVEKPADEEVQIIRDNGSMHSGHF